MSIYDIDKKYLLDLDRQLARSIDGRAMRIMLKPPHGSKTVIMRCNESSCGDCLANIGRSNVCPVCSSRVDGTVVYQICHGCGSKLRVCGLGHSETVITGCSQLIPGFEDEAEDVV